MVLRVNMLTFGLNFLVISLITKIPRKEQFLLIHAELRAELVNDDQFLGFQVVVPYFREDLIRDAF